MFYSPLRYPGGKNKLSAFIAKICIDNNINGHYVEPYSGGASVALFLLIEGFVDKITIRLNLRKKKLPPTLCISNSGIGA